MMEIGATQQSQPAQPAGSWRIAGLGLLLVLLLGTSLILGPVMLAPAQVVGALITPGVDPAAAAIVGNLRLPRTLLALVAGSMLGIAALLLSRLSGTAGALDPGWSGVLAPGALAAVGGLALLPATPWAVPLLLLAGCGVGLALAGGLRRAWPQRAGRVSAAGLALALLLPFVAFMLLIGDLRIATWVRWCLGSLEMRDWTTWQMTGPLVALALVALGAAQCWPQRSLFGWATTVCAAASSVAAAGAIGLLGGLAGNWALRRACRPAAQLVLAGLAGAILLLSADLAARGATMVLPSPGLFSEWPVGALVLLFSLVFGLWHVLGRPGVRKAGPGA
jgi:iron complex transport system permease protein